MQQTQVLAGYREVSSRQRFYRLPNCKVSSVLIQWENPSCWLHGQETVWQNQHDPNAKHPASHHPSFRTKTTTTHQISFKDTTRRNDMWQMTLQARLYSYRTNNRPFPSSPQPPFQREAKCEVFVMKISFHSYWNWNLRYYHKKNFALSLALKERLRETRKWPI